MSNTQEENRQGEIGEKQYMPPYLESCLGKRGKQPRTIDTTTCNYKIHLKRCIRDCGFFPPKINISPRNINSKLVSLTSPLSSSSSCKNPSFILKVPVLSKTLEKVVCKQLKEFLYTSDVLSEFQSGFSKKQSRTTATTKV